MAEKGIGPNIPPKWRMKSVFRIDFSKHFVRLWLPLWGAERFTHTKAYNRNQPKFLPNAERTRFQKSQSKGCFCIPVCVQLWKLISAEACKLHTYVLKGHLVNMKVSPFLDVEVIPTSHGSYKFKFSLALIWIFWLGMRRKWVLTNF